jgi:hypothetical protein
MSKRTTLYCAIGAALLLAAPLRFAAAADTVPVIDLSQPADTTATDASSSTDTTTAATDATASSDTTTAGADAPDTNVDPATVATDADGNAYPSGGPSGLYQAIVDKQEKTAEGSDHPGQSGLLNALGRLRTNMERMVGAADTPDSVDTEASADTPDNVDTADSTDTAGAPTRVSRLDRPQGVDRIDHPARPDRPDLPDHPNRPERPDHPERGGPRG